MVIRATIIVAGLVEKARTNDKSGWETMPGGIMRTRLRDGALAAGDCKSTTTGGKGDTDGKRNDTLDHVKAQSPKGLHRVLCSGEELKAGSKLF